MSRLRILEEARRRPKTMGSGERERVLSALKLALSARDEVELAVVHGGFVGSEVFRDIDVALYTGHRVSADEAPSYADGVREELERAIGIGVDVQLLDYAPPGFTYRALTRCRVLVERRPGLSSILRVHAKEDLRRLRRALRLGP